MDRNKLLEILDNQVENKNVIKHMLAAEACMGALFDYLREKRGKEMGETRDEWLMAGLMHDGDYRDDVPAKEQGVKITEILKNEGVEVTPAVAQAMAAHNWDNTKVEPKTLMDWSLFCADSLTGLIVACALVRPDKKLSTLTTESVLKKFPDKRFAAGTRRKDIKMSEEKLGIPLEEFVEICLKAMQAIGTDLGL